MIMSSNYIYIYNMNFTNACPLGHTLENYLRKFFM